MYKNNEAQPLGNGGGSRLATGIPLLFLLYERGKEGALCNLEVAVKFSVLTLAILLICIGLCRIIACQCNSMGSTEKPENYKLLKLIYIMYNINKKKNQQKKTFN